MNTIIGLNKVNSKKLFELNHKISQENFLVNIHQEYINIK